MAPKLSYEVVSISEVPFGGLTQMAPSGPPVILIVDDESLVADSLAVILGRAGFTTMTAYDGQTALELATRCPPALLITDVAMPRMNGVQLALAVVSMLPTCRVLLFSGHATFADLAIARDAGYHFRLLTKPVHPVDMMLHVSKTLRLPATAALPIETVSAEFAEDMRVRA